MKKLPSFILNYARALSYEFETAVKKQFYKTERATPAHRENARQSATLKAPASRGDKSSCVPTQFGVFMTLKSLFGWN